MKYLSVLILSLLVFLSSCKDDVPPVVTEQNDETYSPFRVKNLLDNWQKKTFNYFYEGASPTGMALEGNDRGDGGVVTSGGSGFGVMALVVGMERKWITRETGVAQLLKIVKFLGKAERFHGVWSHWYNQDGTAHPFGSQVDTGDLIETSFMVAGLLAANEYLTDNVAYEKEVRDSIESFMQTIEWDFYAGTDGLYWLWEQPKNLKWLKIQGWNEGMIAYILAMGAPDHQKISADIYDKGFFNSGSIHITGRQFSGYPLELGESKGGPLFFSHYSFLGLNPHLMEDKYVNYWMQNQAHTLINRHYCVYEANTSYLYSEKDWGLTACYGTAPNTDYKARSPLNDDGVIAPTAALSAFPYTPFYSTQVLMRLNSDDMVHGKYGFADSYSPSARTAEKRHLAIDQGPIVVMMENYRSGLIWNLMMKNKYVIRGLQAAQISTPVYAEGFHKQMLNTYTKELDLMRHPDRGQFELDYNLETAGNARFVIKNTYGETVKDTTIVSVSGENVFRFLNNSKMLNKKKYTVYLQAPSGKDYNIAVRLR